MSDTDEKFLWQMIELAWMRTRRTGAAVRQQVRSGPVDDCEVAMRPFTDALLHVLTKTMTGDGLRLFAEEFERRLYALDGQRLAEHLELGDDGFLDARALIVALGEEHYRAVLKDPRAARPRAAAERIYPTIWRAWEIRFGEAYPRFDTPIATGSNLAGWPYRRAAAVERQRLDVVVEGLERDLGLATTAAPRARLVRVPALPQRALETVLLRLAARVRARRDGRSS